MHNQPATQKRKLWTFHGGIHVPENKEQTNKCAIEPAILPKRLILPLQQHIGQAAQPIVNVGDRVLKGQMVAKSSGFISAPVHASSSGTVVEIGELPVPHPSGLPSDCIIIETDGKDEWIDTKPAYSIDELTLDTLGEIIREAGIVGLGGATFPSSVKASAKNIHTLIVNGAECEPYITCDDRLMQERSEKILSTVAVIKRILGAKECLIGIEDNKPEAIAQMQQTASELGLNEIEVVTIPTLYPSGGEKQLIKILTGKEVPSGGNPTQIGIVCFNVATAAAIGDAINHGKPLISRAVTITGDGVSKPCNLEALIGTPLNELISQAGGYTQQAAKLILGGPMMGFTMDDDQVPLTKAINCLLVATEEEIPNPGITRPCIRCSECANVCPSSLLPQQMYWHCRSRDLEKAKEYNLFDCIECGCCSHVCPSRIPLVQYFRSTKTAYWKHEQEIKKTELAKMRSEARTARIERAEQEKKEKLRLKKEAAKKKAEAAAGDASKEDVDKAAAIEAAKKRAAEKKAAQKKEGITPANTENLSEEQQRQIDQAEARRSDAEPTEASVPEEK